MDDDRRPQSLPAGYRRGIITAIAAGLLASAIGAHGSPSGKVVVVGRDGRGGPVRLAYAGEHDGGAPQADRVLIEIRPPSAGSGGLVALSRGGVAAGSGLLVADGVGTVPPAVEGGEAALSMASCRVEEKRTDCRCVSFGTCKRSVLRAGGVRLVCGAEAPDPACAARKGTCLVPGCLLEDWNGDRERVLACGGDSNTYGSPLAPSWCVRLREWLDDFTVRGFAWPWTRASDDPDRVVGFGVSSRPILAGMLRERPLPDIVILAWGTNDIPRHTAEQTARAIEDLVRWMRAAGVVPIVATIPWQFGLPPRVNAMIDAANASLGTRYPGCLIDFTTITPPTSSWYYDVRHLNDRGQERRAMEAYYALATLPRSCGR